MPRRSERQDRRNSAVNGDPNHEPHPVPPGQVVNLLNGETFARPGVYRTKVAKCRIERFNEIGAVNTKIRTLIGGEDGAMASSLHEIIIGKGGSTAMHRHDWEHQLLVEDGRGRIETVEGKVVLSPGDVVLVGAGEDHRFVQTGARPLRFLVVTPL